jgi:hypothetical protein
MAVAVGCFGQSGALPSTPNAADSKEILRRAPLAYYSLKREGLIDFRCQITPDWDSFYKSVKTDAVGREQLLPILKTMRFQVAVGPDGAATVSHQSDAAPPSEAVADRIRRSTDGMEQVMTGFFQTWLQFMINSLFPDPDGKYQLQDFGDKFVLTLHEGKTDVVESMSRDLVIDTVKATAPEFEGTVNPTFAQNKKGLVLSGYVGNTKATSSGNSQHISIKIDYSEVQGLTLPRTVMAEVALQGAPIEIIVSFSDCHIKTR